MTGGAGLATETRFAASIKKTIQWYLQNHSWWEEIISGKYQNYYEKMYGGNEGVERESVLCKRMRIEGLMEMSTVKILNKGLLY